MPKSKPQMTIFLRKKLTSPYTKIRSFKSGTLCLGKRKNPILWKNVSKKNRLNPLVRLKRAQRPGKHVSDTSRI